jgi:hypothetical protein
MTLRKFFESVTAIAALNATLGIAIATAQNSPPLSNSWNIASTGKAASSGELLFRVTPGNGDDPVEVTVFVLSGSNETGIASSIRRNFTLQLDAAEFDVQAGEGANVRVSQADASPDFAVELLDSDVENVRVTVQSIAPVAPPTVPSQSLPATPPNPSVPAAQPQAPGDGNPPPESAPPQGPAPATPSAPPSQNGSGEAGASASAPPPGSPGS